MLAELFGIYSSDDSEMNRSILLILLCLALPARSQELPPTDGSTVSHGDLSRRARDLKSAARNGFAKADVVQARRSLTQLLELYRAEHAGPVSWRGTYAWSRRLAEVAAEFLRVGKLDDAMAVLGEAADLEVPLRTGFDNGLSNVAGGLYRRLEALDSDERYTLLSEWSMPTETRLTVRVLETFVPGQAPPPEFARALGERPRETSFQIGQVGEIFGLFSSAWELVRAAQDAGRLRRLTSDLESLTEQNVPNAGHVLTLAMLVAATRHDEELVAELTGRLTRLRDGQPANVSPGAPGFRNAWQYGCGGVRDGEVTEFIPVEGWSGAAWQPAMDRPDKKLGWLRIDRLGGHAGNAVACIRRWTATADGEVAVTGTLQHGAPLGDGVRARIVSSRSGMSGEWTAHHSSQTTDVASIPVSAGDTIDFIVDMISNDAHDGYQWKFQLQFTTSDSQRQYDSVDDFCGPNDHAVLSSAVVAAACLRHDWLKTIGADTFAGLIHDTCDSDLWLNRRDEYDAPLLRPALRRAWAMAVTMQHGSADAKLLDDPGLTLWSQPQSSSVTLQARGHVSQTWLASDDHILHLGGPGNDALLLKYPLSGEFEFSCDVEAGGRPGTDGGLSYAGLRFLLEGGERILRVTDADGRGASVWPADVRTRRTGSRYIGPPEFNRVSLAVNGDRLTVAANGQLAWSDAVPDESSPWIGLCARSDCMPIFRRLRISGNPLIPREVQLSNGTTLRGWTAGHYDDRLAWSLSPDTSSESRPGGSAIAAVAADGAALDHDWFTRDGIIHGTRRECAGTKVAQSHLRYFRPLLNGESISYEFLYEPHRYEVHPSLGRLAFLIEPAGVNLHWMTDGDREWTGLAEGNSLTDPLDRRGPGPLPLVEGDWNRVTIALADETVTLSLNGELIYQRQLDRQDDRSFGFYHDACRTAVQIKNVVLRGDWPERLTPQQLNYLTELAEPNQNHAHQQALSSLFGQELQSDSVLQLAQHAAALTDEERFSLLIDWVLPGRGNPSIRMIGRFAPLPAPPLEDQPPLGMRSPFEPPVSGARRVADGAVLIAPAIELVEVAGQLGRLDEIRERLQDFESGDPDATRVGDLATSRQALLALVSLADGDSAAAIQNLDWLIQNAGISDETEAGDRWPETLVVWFALRDPATSDAARELVDVLAVRVSREKLGASDAWKRHILALAAAGRFQHELKLSHQEPVEEQLRQWAAVSHVSARSRGLGFPSARWQRLPHRVDIVSVHDRDYLYFQSPLQGDFQVECDVASTFGWRESHLAYGGQWVLPRDSLIHFSSGDLREQTPWGRLTEFAPKLSNPGPWSRYRLVVEAGRLRVFFNGRLLHEQLLPDHPDPWLAVRNHWMRNGAVRDVRISGDPIIPEQISLAESSQLEGWLPYFDEPVGGEGNGWTFADGLLTGHRQSDAFAGSRERLLHYHRPMLEDGTVEYEFYYEPDGVHVHPALGRLAFLLDPAGVRVHWATHGELDETGFGAANVVAEPENQRGPDRLPLLADAWNKMQLTLTSDSVRLLLNGQPVFERTLEPSNLRNFGVFHDANRSEARVRQIVWRGNWPRELPRLSEQELADVSVIDALEEKQPDLVQELDINFEQQRLPHELLQVNSSPGLDAAADVTSEPDGLHVVCRGPGERGRNTHSLAGDFELTGDFDLTASFADFRTTGVEAPDTAGGLWLFARFENGRNDHVALIRKYSSSERNRIATANASGPADRRVVTANYEVYDGSSGVLRLSRRAGKVYFLLAEDESAPFRLINAVEVPPGSVPMNGIGLIVEALGTATSNVVWKRLTVRAEGLNTKKTEQLAGELRPPDGARNARYVRVDLPETLQFLSLAEVEVFSNDRNIAKGKMASQSSVDWGGPAKLAVDGNRNGHFVVAKSTTHTALERGPWWEVDLGQSIDIDRVLIWNRTDYDPDRLLGFRVQLLDEQRKPVWEYRDPVPPMPVEPAE